MSLYLCVFDENCIELEGVEVGSYADFNFFRNGVTATVEAGDAGTKCPLLIKHSDSDGQWTSEEASELLVELEDIAQVMREYPPVEFNTDWKKQVAQMQRLHPRTLLECFFDIDGEPLVDRLHQLAQLSVATGQPILFQ